MRTIWPAVSHPLLAPLACLVVIASLGCADDPPGRPDLVLVTVDRLAADRLACFGGPRDAGPGLCELAQNGTLFSWATTPALGEAMAAASALTGLAPAAHEVDDRGLSFLSDGHETIAESLARAGYATAAFVASPRLNRSRRLDQGFEHYADRAPFQGTTLPTGGTAGSAVASTAASVALASSVQSWIEGAEPPYFVWIHARSEWGLAELDRLVDRLAGSLESDEDGPGVLLVALAGEADPAARGAEPGFDPGDSEIDFRAHRIPLLWRPPGSERARASLPHPSVSAQLASLLDVAATLRAAALLPEQPPTQASPGLDLASLIEPRTGPKDQPAEYEERFLLLRSALGRGTGIGEVGLASGPHLYVRRSSPLDGSGRPVPTSQLHTLSPRFATVEPVDPSGANDRLAEIAPITWRTDVLSAQSPVPRLEFHLARLLAKKARVTGPE